ncbi:MAG: hypothetical protein HY774_21930 [Acidobacteria bacterium]|nr:hypothetical protein [Acidobacteriota bacterium]
MKTFSPPSTHHLPQAEMMILSQLVLTKGAEFIILYWVTQHTRLAASERLIARQVATHQPGFGSKLHFTETSKRRMAYTSL